jgi:putative glycosyltransferase (TIGR04372 family)
VHQAGRVVAAYPQLARSSTEMRRALERLRIHEFSCSSNAGDLSFHRGERDDAMRHWKESFAIQCRAIEELYPGYRDEGTTDFISAFWTVAIGHIALLDAIVKLAHLGMLPNPRLRLHVDPERVANAPYLELLRPYIEFCRYPTDTPSEIKLVVVDQKLNLINTNDGLLFLYDACAKAERAWKAQERPALLSMPEDYRAIAQAALSSRGFDCEQWFVTMHVRGHRHRGDRQDITRNVTLHAYREAIREIRRRDGQVILLGERGTEVPDDIAELIVDYANAPFRDGRIDVYLCGACRFYVGTTSGISHVAGTFGVPALFTNVSPPFSRPWRAGDLWIPKLLWSESESRYLSLAEMMAPPTSLLDTRESQGKFGLRAVDNDSIDIRCAVEDMLDQLDTKQPDDEVARINDASIALLRRFERQGCPYDSRLSPAFAFRHQSELTLR